MTDRMRKILWAMLLAGGLAILGATVAFADQPGTSAVTLVPADGRGSGARLRAQTVDVTLSEDKAGLWADTRVWFQLSNPLTRALTLTLALPGPQLTPGELPANLELKLGDVALPLQPAAASSGGQRVAVPLASEENAGLLLTYRQAVPEAGGRAVYAYPLAAASQWGGTPESLRVTINFAAAPAPEQILGLVPEPARATSQTLVWSWDTAAAPDVWVAFLRPGWWAGFNTARAAAGAAGAPPSSHLALSRLYQQLAGLPSLSFLPELDFYARYYPPAVAELQAATVPTSGGSPGAAADQITAHSMLATLYRDQANRLGSEGGSTYLVLAATEAQAALSAGATDAALKSLATDAYLQLAAAARSRGDVSAADSFLARLAALEPATRASTAAEEQKAARVALAAQQISRGSVEAARQILTETFGRDLIDIPALRAPVARQMLVSVETTVTVATSNSTLGPLAGKRKITLTFTDARDPAALQTLIGQVGEAWRPINQARFTAGADWLAVAFAFADDRSLGETQTRLARLLPADAELALLEAVLSPEMLSLRAAQDQFRRTRRYLEVVDLVAASDAWQARANEIRLAGQRLATRPQVTTVVSPTLTPGPAGSAAPALATPPAAGPADLGQVQLALWGDNAQGWEGLAGRSFARYAVSISSETAGREWQVPAGMRRQLDAETGTWQDDRLTLLAAGGVILLLLVAYAIWRLI